MEVRAERRYTLADLDSFPDDGRRWEIVDGVLFVSPAPRIRHEWMVGEVFGRLREWTLEHGGYPLPGGNVDVADDTHLEPDVVLLRPGRTLPDTLAITDAPDLIVEVSSPSTKAYDTGTKRARYARAAVAEFWFVDLDAAAVFVSRPAGERWYGEPVAYEPGDVITTPLLPGFTLPVDALFPGPFEPAG
jgi:Uma2 family endonuclease